MKMIFDKAGENGRFQCCAITGIVLLLCTAQLNADVLVNNIEKNDKVSGSVLSEMEVSPDQTGSSSGVRKNWQMRAEQWETARSGESLLSLPVLNEVINHWLQDTQNKIEIQYPGGEEGQFWVQELSDWLVSLAIPSAQIVLVPGSGADDMIKFSIVK